MTNAFVFPAVAVLQAWALCVAAESSASGGSRSLGDTTEFAERVLGPRPLEFRPRGRECAITNLAWMVGKWVWVEKRRTADFIFPGAYFAIDRFCVFPYMDYADVVSCPTTTLIAAEFQATDVSSTLTPFLPPVYYHCDHSEEQRSWLWLRGPLGLVLRCAHEVDGNWDYLRLWNRAERGARVEYVFFKLSDDPGEPLFFKAELREEYFPDWKRFEGAHKRRLPPLTGQYQAEYQHGSESLILKVDGTFEQIYHGQDGALTLKNTSKFRQSGDQISFDSFMQFALWDGRRTERLEKRSTFFHVVRRISGNVLTGFDGTYRQVKPTSPQTGDSESATGGVGD